MKALVLEEYNHFKYMDVPDPEVGPNEVLVRVRACGICGSDVHGMDGSTGRRIPPLIMGHEASGVIETLGSSVSGWQVGERVTFDSTIYCGTCRFCREGYINLCDHRRVLGVSCGEYRQHGAFAEFVSVPQHILYRVPEAVSFAFAAMVEPISIALHGINRIPIHLNDTAVVVGAGMIGLSVIQLLKRAGCGRIMVADVDSEKLDLATKLGATHILGPDLSSAVSEVFKQTDGHGADIAIEAVGITSTLNLAIDVLRKGGALSLIGNVSPDVTFPLQKVVTRELSLNGTCASRGDYPACLDMISRGDVRLDALLSEVAPLSTGSHWFDRLQKGGLMKVVLEP